jgi:hypothetical protein
MADYQLTADANVVLRTADQAHIPADAGNRDWLAYEAWRVDGGVPDPYVAPPPAAPTAQPETTVLYDHENRLRALEGQPPLTLADLVNKMKEKT